MATNPGAQLVDLQAKRRVEPKKSSPKDNRPGDAIPWLKRIDAALNREEKKWRPQARKVVERFRDERGRQEALDTTRVNILWSNTEILMASVFPRVPKPDVRRRFSDGTTGESVNRLAAEVLERCLAYVVDSEDVESALGSAIEDMLIPGRGTVWVSYEPEVEEPEEDDTAVDAPEKPGPTAKGEAEPGSEMQTPSGGRIVAQRLRLDYVYWEDYCEGPARQDEDVPWKARRHALPQATFDRKFPEARKLDLKGTNKRTNASGTRLADDDEDTVEVWEVWDKPARKRFYVATGYKDILQSTDDPYGLEKFYPTPKPLRSVTTNDRQEPQPEYLQYQDQALELDRVVTRLHRLTEQLKFRGIYDASLPDGAAPGSSTLADVTKQDDGVFLPYANFAALKQTGGIEAAFGIMPIEMIVGVIDKLSLRRQQLIEEIYQITGISDIMRGSTDPGETKGAQTLKAQFGSVRIRKRTRAVERLERDSYRLMAEIIAEHWTIETMKQVSGLDLPTAAEKQNFEAELQRIASLAAPLALPPPTPQAGAVPPTLPAASPPGLPSGGGASTSPPPPAPSPAMSAPPLPPTGATAPAPAAPPLSPGLQAPPIPPDLMKKMRRPTWEDVVEVLRSDKLRGYRVDIETDTSDVEDQDADKQRRVEAAAAVQQALQGAYVAAMAAPKTLPLVKELTLFVLRTFKPARSLEQAVEDTFTDLTDNPPTQMPGQDNKGADPLAQAKLELQKLQLDQDGKFKLATLAADAADKAARIALERDRLQHDKAKTAAEIDRSNIELQMQDAHHQDEIGMAHMQHRDTMQQQRADRQMQQDTSNRDFGLKQQQADNQHGLAQQELGLKQSADQRAGQAEARAAKMDAHTMAAGNRDYTLKAAAQNKALVDEQVAAEGQPEPEPEAPSMGIMGVVGQLAGIMQGLLVGQERLAQTLAQGEQQIAERLAQSEAMTAQMLRELATAIAAPKRVIRGRDGRVAGVETMMQ